MGIGTIIVVLALGGLTLCIVFVLPWRNTSTGDWDHSVLTNLIRKWRDT